MMRLSPLTNPCIVCGEQRWNPTHQKNGYQYLRCGMCGLEVTDPIPSADEIAQYYKNRLPQDSYNVRLNYQRKDEVHRKIANWAIKLNGGKPPATVLDVGCLDGSLLDSFKEAGAKTYGIEIQTEAAARANAKHENRVFNGTIEQYVARGPEQQFDMIMAIGVIEHVTDPVNFLKSIRRLIKSSGLLVLQSPNTGSILRHLMGSKWPPYFPVEHIYLFSRRNLALLLGSCGFEEKAYKPHWKTLELEFFYLMTEIFMPYLHKYLRRIVPRLPARLRRAKLPLYSGEMLVSAQPVAAHQQGGGRRG